MLCRIANAQHQMDFSMPSGLKKNYAEDHTGHRKLRLVAGAEGCWMELRPKALHFICLLSIYLFRERNIDLLFYLFIHSVTIIG